MKFGLKSHHNDVMIFIPIVRKTRSVMLIIGSDGALRYDTGHPQRDVDYDYRRIKIIGVDII